MFARVTKSQRSQVEPYHTSSNATIEEHLMHLYIDTKKILCTRVIELIHLYRYKH